MNLRKLNECLSKLTNELTKLNEMVAHQSFVPFNEFRTEALKSKQDRSWKVTHGNEEQYEIINGVRIFASDIRHVQKDHSNTTQETWDLFLNNFNPETDEKYKAKVDGKYGKRYLYRFFIQDKCFAYVLDYFSNKEPRFVSMWMDNPNTIQNWLNNEKVRGNKTSNF